MSFSGGLGVLLLLREVGQCLSSAQPLWIVGIQPFTGGAWDAGISMRFGANLVLEEINSHPTLLPGYELRVVWQDSQCNGDLGGSLFMDNLFKHQYHVFAPGVLEADMDVDGDGQIETSDTAPLTEIWNVSRVNPHPVGVMTGCSGTSSKVIPLAFYSNLPIISPGASFAALSDRERFPNFYRTILPDPNLHLSYLALVKLFGHRRLAAVVGITEDFLLAMSSFAVQAAKFGIELVGTDYGDSIPGFKGVRVSDSPGSAREGVQVLVQKKARCIALLIFLQGMRAVLCEAYDLGFMNAVYFVYGWHPVGWWNAPTRYCSVEKLSQVAGSMIAASMVHWRLDADTRLTCSSSMTVQRFKEEFFRRQGAEVGELGPRKEGFSVYGDGAQMADAVCMFAVMLHEVLFVRGISYEELISRTSSSYAVVQEVLAATDFDGLIGRVRFEPNSSDASAAVKVEQLQEGHLVELARYLQPDFVFLGNGDFIFQLPGERVFAGPLGASNITFNLAEYRDCEGLLLNFSDNNCTDCPENSEYVPAASACLCIKGFRRNESSKSCVPCEAGRFSSAVGAVACTACEAGRSSPQGSTTCSFCARGTFSNSSGNSACQECPPLQTTQDIASMSASACICAQGTFGTPASGGCRACPAGSDTKGTGKVRLSSCLCQEGTYMPLDISGCQDCPAHMKCPRGSNLANERYLDLPAAVRDEEQQFMELEKRFWSSREEPLSIFKCRSRENCIGGVPGNACGEGLVGRVCERCVTGSYWTGDRCKECVAIQRSYFLYPALPVLLSPLGTLLFYLCSGDGFDTWGTWWYSAAALLFVTLNTCQVLGSIVGSVQLALPNILIAVFGYYSTTNDLTAGLSVDCVQLTDLVSMMTAKTLYPAIIVGACGVNYVLSLLMALLLKKQSLQMDPNRILGVIGSILFTFFGSVASMSLLLFKCSGNPNGLYTLAVDLTVICFISKEWIEGLGIGITCVLFYIFGFGSMVGYVLYKAPEKIKDRSFQLRWQFLFNKFHCSAYWWGIIFLGKNFSFNLVPTLAPHEFSQLYLFMTVAVFYVSFVTAVKPYRSGLANLLEILAGVCIVYTVSLLTWYADSQGREEFDFRVAIATVVITAVVPAIAFPGALACVAVKGLAEQTARAGSTAAEQFSDWKETFWAFSRIDEDMGRCILLNMGEAERACLQQAVFLINTDVFGTATRRRICGSQSLKKLRESALRGSDPGLKGPLDLNFDKAGVVTQLI